MAATTNFSRPTGTDPVKEAVRATIEASHRTIHSQQEAARFSRDLFEQSTEASRKLFAAYTTGVTAGIEATFEVQNAALLAGVSLLETAATSNRDLAKHITDTAHQAQQATLEAWQAGVHAADTFVASDEKA
jgi:hypothetical protein